jgi:hypothetical protein
MALSVLIPRWMISCDVTSCARQQLHSRTLRMISAANSMTLTEDQARRHHWARHRLLAP